MTTTEAFSRAAGPPKLLYAVEESVHITGLGRSKLYELMANGAIESVKVGKRRLIPADALQAFVQSLRSA